MEADDNLEKHIMIFWDAMTMVFQVQEEMSRGSHVHIAPIGRKQHCGRAEKDRLRGLASLSPISTPSFHASAENSLDCECNWNISLGMDNLVRGCSSASFKRIARMCPVVTTFIA